MNFKIPIILASNSPRRQELLAALGLRFTVAAAAIDEVIPGGIQPMKAAEYLARKKAVKVGTTESEALIIAADTVVILDETLLGKPADLHEAGDFLVQLSGRKHQVVTGVCIKYQEKISLFHDITQVHFANLTAEEIDYYVNTFKPLDKAGAYGIQEWIGMIGVTKIEGSYFNVVGLPVNKLYQELKEIEGAI